MTNRTINKALLSFGVFATILAVAGIISALIAQSAAAENTTSVVKTAQSHSCHYKAKNTPILHSCNDVVRESVSHPGDPELNTK
ncbi:MAG TPA: hypothetical protein VH796_08185 [Nitrososphaeraceae archaeon]|jgi:hypothetical protein